MNKEKIYIKKLEDVGKHSVWLVDGAYIRKEINENFVEYDEHYHLPFIPKDEFWIDTITNPDEWNFFIDHLIKEQWHIEQGQSYEEAIKKADHFEKKERAKALHFENTNKNIQYSKNTSPEILEKIHGILYSKYETSLNIWIVNGKCIRDYLFVEYADGGHDRVYSFIPKGEIWLEDCLTKGERDFILLHELHERFLMGEGKDYEHAHRGATIVEDYYRDHPRELEKRIKEELIKNTH